MRILYVDISISGHHISYMRGLTANNEENCILIVPEKIDEIECKQYVCQLPTTNKKNLASHYSWIRSIKKIADLEKPDIIHFLWGDYFYSHYGLGLSMLKKYKLMMTLHLNRESIRGHLSLKMTMKKMSMIVVHSEYIKMQLQNEKISNIFHVEYPQFNSLSCDREVARNYFMLKPDIPVIGCIGGTMGYKGLDILLEALKNVKTPFQLLVAGKKVVYDEQYIREHTATYSDRVHACIKFLSDEELSYALNASDIIALPYRRWFNGASGPLGEGVSLGKCIIGPSHGTLRYTIENNHLGYIFESENIESLSETIEIALQNDFIKDSQYVNYQKSLSPEKFRESYNMVYEKIIR